ncbi:MAG TPA: hypothetical protein VFN37_04410 [Candidatus Baltobacteraceae bacterium]|nr:hypothetical protein [Candidatus Baltobacteraceae bacterium]
MAQTIDFTTRIEGIAQYLGAMYPTASITRYEDDARDAVGFHFTGAPHADAEFERGWVTSLATDEVVQEMHLHHVCAEINDTPSDQRVIFGASGVLRTPL